MKFAIVDIETTGSHASGNSITEIGVVIHDGERVLDEFQTLLNPGVYVPSYITALTGITNEMLEGAPSFADIADELWHMLSDCVFVAHNAQFDYSFIKEEFEAIGMRWQSRRMCTVRLARKAFPGAPSYSLGNICNWLNIPMEQAHRALSDARAAARVFEKCKGIMDEKEFSKMITRGAPELFLPPHLDKKVFDGLPSTTGVYFMMNEKGKPIYIGKANNIRKRVQQHFTTKPESERLQAFMREIHDIHFELTGTEMIAYLLEDFEIRQHWPKYNEAQKKKVIHHHIIQYIDQKGYVRLAIQKSTKASKALRTFASAFRAKEWLMQMANEFEIDPRFLGMDMFDINAAIPDKEVHNDRILNGIETFMQREPSLIIRGSGRSHTEYSAVVIEKGVLKGFGFFDDHIHDEEVIRDGVRLLPATEVNAAMVRNYIEARIGV